MTIQIKTDLSKEACKRNQSLFEGREKEYLNHPFTHVDFVIYSKLNKSPYWLRRWGKRQEELKIKN